MTYFELKYNMADIMPPHTALLGDETYLFTSHTCQVATCQFQFSTFPYKNFMFTLKTKTF